MNPLRESWMLLMRIRNAVVKSVTSIYRKVSKKAEQAWSWADQSWKHVGYIWTGALVIMGISLAFNIGFGSQRHYCTHGASSIGPINLKTGKGPPAKTEACL